ncbi:hypothetical protein BDV10DRAFT_179370 [Aspergillus recurvatus]
MCCALLTVAETFLVTCLDWDLLLILIILTLTDLFCYLPPSLIKNPMTRFGIESTQSRPNPHLLPDHYLFSAKLPTCTLQAVLSTPRSIESMWTMC